MNFFDPLYDDIGFPNLTNVTFGAAVDTINFGALSSCTSLKRVYLPNNIKWCDSGAFPDDIERIEVSDLNSYLKMGGVFPGYYPDAHLYFNGNIITDLVIPESIDEINSGLFLGDKDLISVDTNKAKIIHSSAVSSSNLKYLVIGESVTTLGDLVWWHAAENWEEHPEYDYIIYSVPSAFSFGYEPLNLLTYNATDCEYHSWWHSGPWVFAYTDSLIIGDRVKRIPRNFVSLGSSTLTIPRSVEKIGMHAFYDCYNLKTINWNAKDCTAHYYYEVPDLPESFPDGYYYENEYSDRSPFIGCYNLSHINIGSEVLRIEGGMFNLPYNYNHYPISTVTCHATVPPVIDADCFSSNTYNNATLYVPEGSLEAYRNAVGWKEFFKCVVIEDIPGGDDDKLLGDANDDGKVNIDDVTTLISYLLQGYVTPFNAVNADVDEDGSINIADVTALISLLLKSN